MVNISKLTQEQIAELAFTQEEREQLKKSRMMPITYDEDCPPVTPERDFLIDISCSDQTREPSVLLQQIAHLELIKLHEACSL